MLVCFVILPIRRPRSMYHYSNTAQFGNSPSSISGSTTNPFGTSMDQQSPTYVLVAYLIPEVSQPIWAVMESLWSSSQWLGEWSQSVDHHFEQHCYREQLDRKCFSSLVFLRSLVLWLITYLKMQKNHNDLLPMDVSVFNYCILLFLVRRLLICGSVL